MLGHWAALLPTPLPASPYLLKSAIDTASLGVWALQFTPRVAVLEDAVVAEMAGSARLFGDLAHLHTLVEAGAVELGAKLAWAPTGTAALALVRHGGSEAGDGFQIPLERVLDALPLEALRTLAGLIGRDRAEPDREAV